MQKCSKPLFSLGFKKTSIKYTPLLTNRSSYQQNHVFTRVFLALVDYTYKFVNDFGTHVRIQTFNNLNFIFYEQNRFS